ncbi:nuclear pore complex protein Nup214 isoform X1 [Vanessa atalanta]|uniref:nuclear pore complex protein Nup214 isoform X1 n=1 Tax=Vanessa atalanta TaxID=42275 RepID=UPI001FCDED80|nr:nuclear pore complex protein Nup214 isoform X1 [Vanessa atalanta]
MEVQFGPNAIDEPSLLYKLQRKIKVFNTNNPLPNRGYNLVACSSRYGIVFVASPNAILSVYYLRELIDKECEPQHLSVNLQIEPSHIAVNCNQEWLAVIGGQSLLVYKCMDFHNADIRPSVSIKCDVHPSTFVSALQWNPCIPDTLGIIYFDGTLLISQVSTMQVKKIQSNARCLCWSPKGKQLVTGNNDGTLTQYKPDLSPMKMVPTPKLFEGSPVEALAIYWISTYQFAVAYRNSSDSSRPAVTIVNTPKGGSPSCYNYDDVCYSMGSNRPWYYYLQGLAQWNMIISSSSNSMEIATLSTTDGSNWIQWCQTDEARPELPLTDKRQENYPVGICIDTAAVHQLPWGENETLPPMPLLHVVSQTGLLSIFNIVNLNKSAPQICTPTQPIALPAAALTRNIPDDVPSQPEPPPVVAQPKQQIIQQQPLMQSQPVIQQQPVVQSQPIIQPQPIIPEPQKQQTVIAPVKAIPQQQNSPSFLPAASLQMTKEPTPPAVAEPPISVPQPKPSVQAPKPQAVPSPEVSAALKSEQERINKAKANQELKNMLIKEVNDFQLELYNFMKVTQENREKFARDIQSINLDVEMNMNTETLRKECDIEDLRDNVTQLKMELVRACAVVAESRTQAEAKEHQEWSQMDPLTAKRIASVKKLSYYVQNQLDQALKALDHKWNENDAKDQLSKPGERMIRPILDDVYQPLVKQQEILCRQQAELKALRKTMNECNFTPMFNSTSLLRSTPFKNKDPLSKLTKNILNMSIVPQNKAKEQLLNSQKLDALRDVLSNHKPIKIKPVNLEITQHLETLKQRYAKSIKEKEENKLQQVPVKIEPVEEFVAQKDIKKVESLEINPKPLFPSFPQMPMKTEQQKPFAAALNTQNFTQKLTNVQPMKSESNIFMSQKIGAPTAFAYAQPTTLETKPDIVKESPIITPSFTPSTNLKPVKAASVARTLFTDTDSKEKPSESPFSKPPSQVIEQAPVPQPKVTPVTPDTKSLLRKMILKNGAGAAESTLQPAEPKNDANTFMGQNICSPTTFSFSKPPTAAAPAAVFASKPTNIFTKIQSPTSEATVSSPVNPKSDETGEPEANTASSKVDKTKAEKPITNMFSLKSPLVSKNQNVPDVLKSSSQGFAFGKTETKGVAKLAEDKSKENVPEKPKENIQQKPVPENKNNNELTPNLAAMTSKTPAQSVIIVDLKKPAAEAKVEKVSPSIFAGTSVSPPPTVSKSPIEPVSPVTEHASVFSTSVSSTSAENLSKQVTITTTASKTSVFGQAVDQSSNILPSSTPPPKALEIKEIKDDSQIETNASPSDDAVKNVTDDVFSAASTETAFSSTSTTLTTTTTTSESKPIVFSTPATTTSASVFSNTPQSFTSQPPAFASNASSVFASASAAAFGPQTTQASIFGTATSPSSIFGSTTSSSIFGGSSSAQSLFSAAASKSVFGGTPAATTQSIFGTSPTTTQASVFGTNQSVFGTSPTASPGFGTPSTQASIFGTPPPAPQTSVFGTPTQTTQASVFGTPTAVTQASIFGTPTTTAQSGSLFGNAESNLFASASISTTSAPSQTSGGNIFGSSSNSVFGSSTANVFGSKQGFTGSNPTAASIFSGGGAAFGQKPATDFWSGGNTSAFGSPGFGQQQPTTQASSIFGTSGGSFSATSAQPFGSPGPFSGGEAKSVFGSPPQQQTAPGAFGGSPVFGTKPMFGGQPSFGSPAFGGFNKSPNSGFGAPASFGGTGFGGSPFGNTSPSKGFGNSSPNFGSPTQSNATFESLATQNTLTFGNLAQQSGQPPQPAPTFNPSPSFTGWRG